MTYGGGAAAAGVAAAAAAIAKATKASGAIVKMDPQEFLKIVNKADKPLIVVAHKKGLFGEKFKYITSYRGLFFYTSNRQALSLPGKAEAVISEDIWIPG